MHAWRYPFALLGIVFVLIGYAFWPKHSTIPVLIYHDISSSTQPADSYTVERSLLSEEFDHLQKNGYTPLSFATAQTLLSEHKLPKRPIIISFDDALPGQALAIQELRARGIHATFFIPSNLVGDTSHMDWVRVREIADSGMEIGGHTANHVHVEQLNLAGLNDEILTDKHRIESEIGRSITVFAYPFQEKTDAAAAALVRAGYTVVRDDDVFKSAVMTNSFDAFLKAI